MRATGIGIAALSAALMSTEVILTRIFSVVIWYHFAFFAISVALFGTAAAALFVHARQHRLPEERTGDLLAGAALLLSVVIVFVDVMLVTVTPNWFWPGSGFTVLTGKLLALFVLAALPFFVGGFAVALALGRYSDQADRLYGWDLAGAGASCLLVVPLLSTFGGPRALVCSAVLAAVAAALFTYGPGASRARQLRFGALGVGSIFALLVALDPMLGLLRVRLAKGTNLDEGKVELNAWNSFSMVTVSSEGGFRGWGLSPKYAGPIPEQKTLVIDLNAMTPLVRFDGNLDSIGYVSHDISAVVYRLRPNPDHVCVIGAGGGKDVLAALGAGAKKVTGVEINDVIVEQVVRGKYRDYTGGLYERPDVRIEIEDGRTFVRSTDERYDVLLLSMVDTSAATAAGAYTLTENSLYTVEAFRDYFAALRPGGVATVSSVTLPGLAVGARLATISRQALLETGARVADSVVVLGTPWLSNEAFVLYDFILKPDGFTPEDVQRLSQAADELGFRKIYLPGGPPPTDIESSMVHVILQQTDDVALAKQMADWPLDVSATRDDRPYFFYQNRLRDFLPAMASATPTHLFGNGLFVIAKVTGLAFLLVGAFFILPMFLARRQTTEGRGRPIADLAYVACLGLGFMFVEIALLQRFTAYLGQPVYTLAVVLLVLLLAGGAGSRWLARGEVNGLGPRIRTVLGVLLAYSLVVQLVAGSLFEATSALSPLMRAVVSVVVLAPIGLLLGAPFPAGLRAVGSRAPTRVPWLFSINGATSVLASIVATVVSLHAGIQATLFVGLGFYVVAAALSLPVLRSDPAPATD